MKAFYLLLLSFLTAVAGHAQTTVTIIADRDNTIFSNDPTASNGAGDGFFAGVNSAGEIRRGLLHFDLSSLPANAVITAATLRVNVIRTAGGSNGVAAHRLTADWGEGTSVGIGTNDGQGGPATPNDATWDKRFYPGTNWGTSGGDFVGIPSASVGTAGIGAINLSSATIVADVQGWITTPGSNFGWILRGTDEAGARNARKYASRENASSTQQPALVITYTAAVPVTLKSFSASLRGKNALIQWTTATEINNAYFEVQHSSNGFEFSTVGKVAGTGNSVLQHDYTFTHANLASGKHYYRLAQHDINGARRYSQVVVLSAKAGLQLQLQPNPVRSLLTVTSSASLESARFQVVSATGQIVLKGIMESQQIDVQHLGAGQYWMNVQTAQGEWIRSSFIKN